MIVIILFMIGQLVFNVSYTVGDWKLREKVAVLEKKLADLEKPK